MRSIEIVRFECGECRLAFDLCLVPVREAEIASELGVETIDPVEPICCPFCGDGDIRAVHHSPIQAPATNPPGGA
jgi:hypothetical protein